MRNREFYGLACAGRVCSVGVAGLMMFGLVVPITTIDSCPSVEMTSPVALEVVFGTCGRSTSASTRSVRSHTSKEPRRERTLPRRPTGPSTPGASPPSPPPWASWPWASAPGRPRCRPRARSAPRRRRRSRSRFQPRCSQPMQPPRQACRPHLRRHPTSVLYAHGSVNPCRRLQSAPPTDAAPEAALETSVQYHRL